MDKKLTCEDYRRMPLSEDVLDHILGCEVCREVLHELMKEADRLAYER